MKTIKWNKTTDNFAIKKNCEKCSGLLNILMIKIILTHNVISLHYNCEWTRTSVYEMDQSGLSAAWAKWTKQTSHRTERNDELNESNRSYPNDAMQTMSKSKRYFKQPK